eukprot:4462644-Karenia_brevis.AAC.1
MVKLLQLIKTGNADDKAAGRRSEQFLNLLRKLQSKVRGEHGNIDTGKWRARAGEIWASLAAPWLSGRLEAWCWEA